MYQPDPVSGTAPTVNRRQKFLLAGVAMASVGAIAVTPSAPSTVAIEQAKTLAYDLTAAMEATASPLEVYGALAENTFGNLAALGNAVWEGQAPLLSQVLANQQGYAEKFTTAFEGIPASIEAWYNGDNGKARLDQAQEALAAGDISEAYRWFNHSMLYAFNGVFGTLRAPGFIFSGIPRGESEYLAGIPEQMAQNVTNLVAATFASGNVTELFEGAFAPFSGAAFELSRVAQALTDSMAAGDPMGAVNALVNTPGILANAVLNGFDYGDIDNPDTTGNEDYSPWAGLIRFGVPSADGSKVVGGLLQSLLVKIPQRLADAIDNTPETAPDADDAAKSQANRTIISAERVSADFAAAEKSIEAAFGTPAAIESAVVTPKGEAAAVDESVKDEKSEVTAVSNVTTKDVAESATDSAAGEVESVTKTKTSFADRVKDRLSEAKAARAEAKEARQAKLKEAKAARAEAKEARQAKAKEAKANEAKDAKDSKTPTSKESKHKESKAKHHTKKKSGGDSGSSSK